MNRLFGFILLFVILGCQPTPELPAVLDGQVLFLGDSITQDGRYVSVIEYELFKQYPLANFDIISIGLSSETVSGLTEPNHPYDRPWLLDRLDDALAAIPAQTVVTCYGMNDGIYHPQSEERLQAFKDGYGTVIEKVEATGAEMIIMTPPYFDVERKENVVDEESTEFGYRATYKGYNQVLADYSGWLQELEPNVQVIDLNLPMKNYILEKRQTEPDFYLSGDGVHPGLAGHVLMAHQFLRGVKVPVPDVDPVEYAETLKSDSLFQLVQKRRKMRSFAWLQDIGHTLPRTFEALPVDEAEARAETMKDQIKSMIENR